MRAVLAVLLVSAVAFAAPVMAATWTEVGDAPDLPPGQSTTGNGSLDTITGSIIVGGDADMYCIYVADPAAFSATTCFVSSIDTQLFLFDLSGNGLSFNDDSPSGCGLQSTVTGAFLPGAGNYLLAISTYDWDPGSAGGDIWADTPYGVERAPDGPGAGSPVIGWSGTSFADGGYNISLTGAGFCEGTTATEPATWGTVKALYK